MKASKLLTYVFLSVLVLGWTLGLTGASVAQEKLTVRGWDFRATKDIQPQIEEFEKLYPEVKIEGINVGWNDHVTKLMMELISGEGAPDVAYQTDIAAKKYYEMGTTAAVTDALPNWKEELVVPHIISWRWVQDGELFGVPVYVGPFCIFYRKDIFDEVGIEFPGSWEEFREVGKKVTIPGKRYMGVWVQGSGVPISITWSRGGQITDLDDAILFNNGVMAEVLQYMNDTVNEDGIMEFASYWSAEGFQKIKEDRWATLPTWHWYQTFALKDQAYTPELDGKWRMAKALPWRKGDPPTGSLTTGDGGWLIPKQTKHLELAKKFVAFLASSEAQVDIARRRGLFPYNREALVELSDYADPFFGGQEHYKVGLEQLDVTPRMQYGLGIDAIGSALGVAVTQIIMEGVPVAEALAEAENLAEKEMRE